MTRALFFLLLGLVPASQGLDLRGWKDLSNHSSSGENLLVNPGFEEGSEGWELAEEFSQLGNFGENGNQGIRVTWEQAESSPVAVKQSVTLKPNSSYTLSFRVRVNKYGKARSSKIRAYLRSKASATQQQTFSNGKPVSIFWGKEGAFRTENLQFNTYGAEGDLDCEVVVFFGQSSEGEVDLDEFLLVEDAPVWRSWVTVPRRTWIEDKGEALEFASYLTGFNYQGVERADYQCVVEMTHPETKESQRLVAPIRDNRFSIQTASLPAGDLLVKQTLVDAANKLILQTQELKLEVRPRPDALAVEVDAFGRTLVKGKPFLPIGIFTTGLSDKEMGVLKGTSFNTILPYSSLSMRRSGPPGVESIREVLDLAALQDLKVIFSVKGMYPKIRFSVEEWAGIKDREQIMDTVTKGLRDHPALLAWYTVDELPSTLSKEIEHWRRLINRNDPGHPVLGVYHRPNELSGVAMGQDILGVDPYPIADNQTQDMELVRQHLMEARNHMASAQGHTPLYLVAQIYNKGVHDPLARANPDAYRTLYRDPSEDEILAMSVLGAMKGARGFIFFSLQDIMRRGPDREQFARRWPGICRVAARLEGLAPFILSTQPSPPIEVEVLQGSVEARVMTAEDGRHALLIAGIGPGPSEAVITFAEGAGLTSETGRTRKEGTSFHFKGENISCDIVR